MACGTWTAVAWARYGHPAPNATRPTTPWTSSFPHPEVDEYHQLEVDAPAPITVAVAKGMDLRAKPIVKGIFWLRAVPTMLRGQPSRPPGPRGVVEDHPLPPGEFATFAEPGYVKIVNTLGAEQLGTGRSRFVTHTRVVTTDAEARRRFRRDWAPMSAGILLIRYVSLPMVKREAERRARNQHRRSDDLPDPMNPYASRRARAIRLWLLRPLIGMVTCDGVATRLRGMAGRRVRALAAMVAGR